MTTNIASDINHIFNEEKQPNTLNLLKKTQSLLFEDYQNKLVFKKIVLPAESLNQSLKLYQWRNTVEKGIVHCSWMCILPVEHKNVLIETKRKYFPYTLKNITKISLTQLLHILRQTLVGFQILYQNFGGFQVKDEFIYIDENFEIEVWGSKQPSSNIFQLREQSQHQFVCSILKLLQKHEIKSNLGIQFIQGLLRYDELAFDIVKVYVENFITNKQLIITGQKSIRQIFMYPKSLKQLKNNHDKNAQKACSLKLIQYDQTQSAQANNDHKQLNLMFSPSKKIQRKRVKFLSPCSAKILKDSDMATKQTENLSGSRDNSISKADYSKQKLSVFIQYGSKKQQNRNYKSHYLNGFGLCQSEDRHKNNLSRYQLKNDTLSGFQVYKELQTNQRITNLFSTDKLQNILVQKETVSNLEMLLNRKVDGLQNYTRETLSQRDNQEKQVESQERTLNPNFDIVTQHKEKFSQNSQEQQQSKPQIDLLMFQQKLKQNFKIFETIDSLADCKQMASSIQIGEQQNRKKSPGKLLKLAKFQSKLYQSIIEQDYFISEIQSPTK